MKFRPVEPNYSCGRAVGETGKYDETGGPFENFVKTLKKYILGLHMRNNCTLVDN